MPHHALSATDFALYALRLSRFDAPEQKAGHFYN
jgi:hypothetical protein